MGKVWVKIAATICILLDGSLISAQFLLHFVLIMDLQIYRNYTEIYLCSTCLAMLIIRFVIGRVIMTLLKEDFTNWRVFRQS